ncbi:MAG: D-alanyl-D-alanine carboxypeptidase [Alphaproteobacteria bacterium]|nr:D-alanyl-D-alanine carboxypeptidase [Alphaproteobacteria bacterium]
MRKVIFAFLLSIIASAANAEFTTTAKSAFLIDYDSGAEIVSKAADVLMPPSSMIKLMTLAVLFDEIKAGRVKLDDRFPVSENADYKNPLWYPASKICLNAGQTVSVRDLILGLIVLSGGDASVVVAEKLAGSESAFTGLMQRKAAALGMEKSTFGNASGLPHPGNLMTSRELAILATHIISDHADLYPMFATKRFEFNEYQSDWCRDWGKTHTVNYNKLLFIMPGADGLKTGHTDDGGYGIVASATSNGRRLIGVMNGFHGRGHDALAAEMKKMITHGFTTTMNKVFYRPGDAVAKMPTWYGRDDFVVATVIKPFAITVPKSDGISGVRIVAMYDSPVPAPIYAGDKIGKLIATRDGREIATADLVARDTVRRVQLFRRVWRNIMVLTGNI